MRPVASQLLRGQTYNISWVREHCYVCCRVRLVVNAGCFDPFPKLYMLQTRVSLLYLEAHLCYQKSYIPPAPLRDLLCSIWNVSLYNYSSHSGRGFKDSTGEQMRVTPWRLSPLHHNKDLTVSTIVRARHRKQCAMAVAYRPALVGGYGKLQVQLKGTRGIEGVQLQQPCHTLFTKWLV